MKSGLARMASSKWRTASAALSSSRRRTPSAYAALYGALGSDGAAATGVTAGVGFSFATLMTGAGGCFAGGLDAVTAGADLFGDGEGPAGVTGGLDGDAAVGSLVLGAAAGL